MSMMSVVLMRRIGSSVTLITSPTSAYSTALAAAPVVTVATPSASLKINDLKSSKVKPVSHFPSAVYPVQFHENVRVKSDPVVDFKTLLYSRSDVLLGKEIGPAPPSPSNSQSERKQSDRLNEDELESVAAKLVFHLSHFYIHPVDFSLFRQDIVHENRISGKTTEGFVAYFRYLNTEKILGHLRFVFIRCGCLSFSTNVETGVVKIRWQISGMGMFRMAALYIPRQLYKKENMIKNSTIVKEGISYYYVDGHKKVYKHITDNKEEDKDRMALAEKLKEKVKKLAPKAPNPATF